MPQCNGFQCFTIIYIWSSMQAQPKLKILIQYNENAKVLKIIIQSAIYILSLMKSISLHHMQTESIIIIQVNFVILVSTALYCIPKIFHIC